VNTWKRILAILIMALSVILTILSIVGIVGNWIANDSITDDIVQVLTGVENALGLADDALGRVDTRVGAARDRIATFEEAVQTAGENFTEDPVVLTALSEKLDLGIAPAVNDLRETVQSVREKVVGIQNAAQAINALPFVSIGEKVSAGDRLQRLSEGVATLTEGVEETRNGIREAKQRIATRAAFAIGKGTSKLDGGLATIETAVTDYGTQVSELRTEISALKASVTFWLDVTSVTVTLILLWLVFSQVVVFILGLSIYRNENLFARWIGGSMEQPSQESATAAGGSEDIPDSGH
jgi:archaellum component FlaC